MDIIMCIIYRDRKHFWANKSFYKNSPLQRDFNGFKIDILASFLWVYYNYKHKY